MASDVAPKYEKMSWFAKTNGPTYEMKVLGLLYLRCLNSSLIDQFQLAINVMGADVLDDVVLGYTTRANPVWRTCFFKFTQKMGKLTLEELKAEKEDFSMEKYRASISKIKTTMTSRNMYKIRELFSGPFEEFRFIMYTDAEVDGYLKGLVGKHAISNDDELREELLLPNDCENDFVFRIDGLCNFKVVKKSEECVDDLFKYFSIYSGRPSGTQLTDHIEKALLKCTDWTAKDSLLLYCIFEEQLKHYFRSASNSYILSENSDLLNSVVDELEIEKSLLHDQENIFINISFQENVKIRDGKKMKTSYVTHLVSLGKSVKITCSKLFYFLHKEMIMAKFVGLSTLLQDSNRLLLFWSKSRYDVLVIVCETDVQYPDDLHENFFEVLKINQNKRFVIVSLQTDTNALGFYNKLAKKFDENKSCIVLDSIEVSQLSPCTYNLVTSKKLSFQGHEVTLAEFFQGRLEFTETVLTNDMVECLLLSDIISLGPSLTKLIEFYIPRSVKRYSVLSMDILSSSKVTGKFAVSGVTVQALKRWVGYKGTVGAAYEPNERYKNFALDPKSEEEEYKRLCSNFGDVHWLHMKDDQLTWVQTHGCIDVIKENVNKKECVSFSLENDLDLKARVVLLLAEPGMGKSTMLSYLEHEIKHAFPTLWVIRINLKDHVDLLDGDISKNAVRYLFLASGIERKSSLERALFKFSLEELGNVVVLLDGFDEISPKFEKQAFELLENMLTTKVKCIWVTSRNFTKDKLEKCMSSISYNLHPFTDDDQRAFFRSFWKCEGKSNAMTDKQMDDFITDVQSLVAHSLNDGENEFTGIPVQTMLVAEHFEQYLTEPKNRELPKKLSLLELFESIIEKKFYAYTRKLNFPNNDSILKIFRKHFLENHMYIALRLLIDDDDLNSLHNKDDILSEAESFLKIENSDHNTGIVDGVENGKPIFIHRFLAEYFVALWCSKYLTSNKTFVSKHLLKPNFKVIRYFFDRLLAKDSDLHNSVLDENQSTFEKLLSESETIINNTDGVGRTPLHLASALNFDLKEGNSLEENKLIGPRPRHMIELLMEYGSRVDVIDALFGWTPVQHAFHCKNWQAVGILLQNNASTENLKIPEGTSIDELCRFVVRRGFVNLMTFLLDQGVSVNQRVECRNRLKKVPRERTYDLICLASEHGQKEIVQLLIDRGADVMTNDEKTTLLYACAGGHSAVANILLGSFGDDHKKLVLFMNKRSKFGRSALHVASSYEVVSCLLSFGADIWVGKDDKNALHWDCENGNMAVVQELALHCACENGNMAVVQALINSLRDKPDDMSRYISTTSYGGNSPLHLSSEVEITRCLIKVGGNVWACNFEGQTPLHVVCKNNDLLILEALLESLQGDQEAIVKYIHHPDNEGNTALHYAFDENIIRCLVAAGGNVWSKNSKGATPLHVLSKNGCLDGVEALIEVVCDEAGKVKYVNMKDAEGRTALHMADTGSVLRCLVKAGGDVWSKDYKGATPIHLLSEMGSLDGVEALIECVCDETKKVEYVNMTDANGRTALDYAVLGDGYWCNSEKCKALAEWIKKFLKYRT